MFISTVTSLGLRRTGDYKMAAPMRSVFSYVQKTATRICCNRTNINTRSLATRLSATPSRNAHAGLYHESRPELTTVLLSPGRSLLQAGPFSQARSYSLLTGSCCDRGTFRTGLLQRLMLAPGAALPQQHQPSRTVVRFSRNKGKKKTVKAVTDRFYRFSNGLWLRTIAGRNKKRWKKTPERKRRTKWHVFCSRSQCKKLDLMVTSSWKQRRYYPDDPLEPFQDRNYKGLHFFPGDYALKRRKDL
ncbi:39S ribosomal protein L35, mitochondrial-like [Patiria miniata]|uniref:Large ribosomal subunit protein bL35m n=1 Tax=Patiria miniata TaxID=46514 RepID=A0A913Z7C1_PATMI|nr:39S ribosomal protein L35, mitochondrial-like [Patiria miniata]